MRPLLPLVRAPESDYIDALLGGDEPGVGGLDGGFPLIAGEQVLRIFCAILARRRLMRITSRLRHLRRW
jgi:hypothetical protein